jgi:uncharacterized iron-regulated membrane protein
MGRLRIKKQTIWRTHSVLGLIAGLGLLVIGLTGSLLIFSKEIDGLLRPEVVHVEVPAGAKRLPMDDLVGKMAASFPGHQLMGWVPAGEPGESDRVWMKLPGEDEHWLSAHLDPYSGKVLSRPAESTGTFTGWILELHYTLLADHVGLAIAGVFALFLFLLGITGLWLYRDFFRHFFRLRWKSSTRILFSDLHKFVGIGSVVFNLILGFTGAWWNLSHVIGHLFEEHPEENAVEVASPSPAQWASIDGMLAEAPHRIEGFQANYLGFPQSPENAFHLYGEHGDAGLLRSPHGSMVSYAVDGTFREASDIREGSLRAQIYDSFVPLHYGTFGGWPVRVLWCLGGMAPGILAVSGFLIWRARHRSARSHPRTA